MDITLLRKNHLEIWFNLIIIVKEVMLRFSMVLIKQNRES